MTRRDQKRVLFIRRSKSGQASQQMMTQKEADAANKSLDKLGKYTDTFRWERAP